MILINAPLKRDFIIELIDQKTLEGVTFQFVKRDNMKLYFDHTGDVEDAIAQAKKAIKSSEFGQALFFNVIEVK